MRAPDSTPVEAMRRVLDDELANLADDGARLSHSVVRRMEAVLASHSSPAVPDAGDVARLTHDEREALRPVLERYARWESAHDGPVFEVVESILAAHDARVRQDTAEQIAQAIEAACAPDEFEPRRESIDTDLAARIAREAGTR